MESTEIQPGFWYMMAFLALFFAGVPLVSFLWHWREGGRMAAEARQQQRLFDVVGLATVATQEHAAGVLYAVTRRGGLYEADLSKGQWNEVITPIGG